MDPKKIKYRNLKILYDEISDVLYISFGEPRPGIASEVKEGDLVRTDPETDEIVGITIIDFKERYMPPSTISIEESAQKIIPTVLKQFSIQ
jgi:uncharacterized protein YuzE